VQGVSDMAGNAMPVTVFTITPTGINDEFSPGHLVIFPNPAEDILYLDIKGQQQVEYIINLYDITGKKVMTETGFNGREGSMALEVEGLEAGLYILELKGNNTIERRKVMLR